MNNSRTLGTPPNSPHPKKENGSFLITLVSHWIPAGTPPRLPAGPQRSARAAAARAKPLQPKTLQRRAP